MSKNTVIVYAKRTAIGKFCGAFANTPATKLGAALVQNAVLQMPFLKEETSEIIMGHVLTGGVGQAAARQTALYGGLSTKIPALTVNKVCGSGLKAILLGVQAISNGDSDIVLSGGQENMSMAPHLLMGSRNGFRFGPVEMRDHMQWDGLTNPYDNTAMGVCGELCAKEYKISRTEQDEFALMSYERSRKAVESGAFKNEVVGIEVSQKGAVSSIEKDEEPFSVDLAKIKNLKPAFDPQGSITAGNASSISDGAALLVLMSEDLARKKGLEPLARIVGYSTHAQEPNWFTTAPIEGIKKALAKSSLRIQDIDLFEINEAFSVVTIAAIKQLGLDPLKVNVRGGAVSLGHPIGASGARIVVTLLHALKQENKKRGVASVCIGGGESCSLIVEAY
jgi:acetyl-CoA C-acetyltransferase